LAWTTQEHFFRARNPGFPLSPDLSPTTGQDLPGVESDLEDDRKSRIPVFFHPGNTVVGTPRSELNNHGVDDRGPRVDDDRRYRNKGLVDRNCFRELVSYTRDCGWELCWAE
jgi:hypothetical protein